MFEIYGQPNCSYCETAKNFLLERAEPFTYYDITKDEEALKRFKQLFPGVKKVPQIMYKDKYWIGGSDDLRNLWYSGPREFWFNG